MAALVFLSQVGSLSSNARRDYVNMQLRGSEFGEVTGVEEEEIEA